MSVVRQQIIDNAITLLGTIATGGQVTVNGQLHTFTFTPGAVDEWRVTAFNDSELPLINVIDEDAETGSEAEIGRLEHLMPLSIRIAAEGDNSKAQMRAMLKDVAQAFGSDRTLGGVVHRMRLTGHGIDKDQKDPQLTVGVLSLTIEYRTDPFCL